MVQFGRFLSVNAVSSMAYLLTQFQGFGRDGRRRILRELTAYDLFFFSFCKSEDLGLAVIPTLLGVMANLLHLGLG